MIESMFAKLYGIALLTFLLIDGLWLGFVARSFYANQLGGLLKPDVNWLAAGIFYAFFIVGLVVFVIAPAVERTSLSFALWYGALFGAIAYATYDLTNLATLKDWPVLVTLVDIVWGGVLAASVSVGTFLLASRI